MRVVCPGRPLAGSLLIRRTGSLVYQARTLFSTPLGRSADDVLGGAFEHGPRFRIHWHRYAHK